MTQVSFILDKEKDAWNIWDKANKTSKRFGNATISQKLIDICKDKTLEEATKDILKYKEKIYNSGYIEIFIKSLETYWKKIEKEFFKRLEKITGNAFKEKITGQVTTIGTCPYNYGKNTFMTSLYYSLPMATVGCMHEIMHLHFHKFDFERIEKEIGAEKTHDLREALTVLLNLEFRDLTFYRDQGYEIHKELRDFITEEWKKEKNYAKLLDKCVEYLKNK